MNAPPSIPPRRARRGSVIVVVLVTLLLASLMLTKFIENSAVELTLATRQADRERLRGDAYSALETALAVMAEIKAIDESLQDPAQGWGDPYGYAGESPREGVTAEFVFTDESGKLSLPGLDFDRLVELAQALGLGDNDARRFADGLCAWTKAGHVAQDIDAEPSRYERGELPHKPPHRSLRSWEELRAVRVARDYVYDEAGELTPFGQALRDNVSLYQFGASNVNALAPLVGAMRGWDATQQAALEAYRAGRGSRATGATSWFRGMEEVRSVIGANADTEGLDASAKLVRVEVTVREGAASMRLSALVALDASVRLPSAVSADGTPPEDASGSAAGETRVGSESGSRRGGQAQGGRNETPRVSLQQASGRGNGGRAGSGETSGGGAASEEKLDYPFRILEVVESAGPAPVLANEDDEAPQT